MVIAKKPIIIILFMSIVFLIICLSVLKKLPYYLKLITIFSFIFYVIFHLYTSFSNQGIPSFSYINMVNVIAQNDINNEMFSSNHYKYCSHCNIYTLRKDNAEHCEYCDVCVFNRSGHYSWVGKCVGRYTFITFYCFLVFFFFFIFIAVIDFYYGFLNFDKNKNSKK